VRLPANPPAQGVAERADQRVAQGADERDLCSFGS